MAIKMRRGAFKDFNPDMMVAGEIAVVLSGDQSSVDGRTFYVCFEPGRVKRLMTFEDLQKEIGTYIDEIVDEINATAERVKESAAKLDEAEETINLLAEKTELAERMMSELEELLQDIKDETANLQPLQNQINAIKNTTINGKSLNKNITLEALDIDGYRPLGNGYEAPVTVQNYLEILDDEKVPTSRKINNKTLDHDITLSAADVQAVPNTRKINGVSLGSDATLTAANIHAYNKPAWLNLVYPVGSIYMSMVSTNPNTLFGTGTWKQIAQGRTLIGINTSDSNFNTVGKTGGNKTKTLAESEIPSHKHIQTQTWPSGEDGDYAIIPRDIKLTGKAIGEANGLKTTSAGGNKPFNIIQPYLTCYIWQRTA